MNFSRLENECGRSFPQDPQTSAGENATLFYPDDLGKRRSTTRASVGSRAYLRFAILGWMYIYIERKGGGGWVGVGVGVWRNVSPF